MLPYFDADGRATYLIGRCTDTGESPGGGAAGYGGHPEDFLAGKYSKLAHTKEYAYVTEPMWGQHTIEDGEPVVIAEGIADAIAAAAAGYSVLSPVAKEFKREHIAPLVTLLEEHDVPRVYVVPDAETAVINRRDDEPDEPERIADAITLTTTPPGIGGGLRTAAQLGEKGVEALVAQLPRLASTPETRKVDLDDYLNATAAETSFAPVLASAKSPESFLEYEKATGSLRRSTSDGSESGDTSAVTLGADDRDSSDYNGDHNGTASALFDLDVTDLTPAEFSSSGDRGTNPLGHTGTSENYFTLVEGGDGDLLGKDYKRPGNPTYNALTYLLVDAGERDVERPMGPLSNRELLVAWRHAKERGAIPEDDPIPRRALVQVALERDLCSEEDVVDGWKLPVNAHNRAIEAVRDNPEIDPGLEPIRGAGAVSRNSGAQFVETCEPPATADAGTIDVEAVRDAMRGERYDQFIENDGLTIAADSPGVGKTTNFSIGAAERDRNHLVALPKHQNCREFQRDEHKPDGYVHPKGTSQPEKAECMDAEIDGRECPKHGDTWNCPRMCPVHELDDDHPIKARYDALVRGRGVWKAHAKLELDKRDWHGGTCPWQEQWDAVGGADRIVTVSEYVPLKTLRDHGDILLDDSCDGFVDEQTVGIDDLVRFRSACGRFADQAAEDRITDTFDALDEFTGELIDGIGDNETPLSEYDVPEFSMVARTYDSRHDVPDHIPESAITETGATKRRYVGQESQYVNEDVVEVQEVDLAERLAQTKLYYERTIIARIQDGDWNGAPFVFDEVLGALAATMNGDADAHDARVAAAFDAALDVCPRCETRLESRNGARVCPACHWDESQDRLTAADDDPARIDAELVEDHDGVVVALKIHTLPILSAMPDPSNVLALDATGRPEAYASLFGANPERVTVQGDEAYSLPAASVTQIANGAYHGSTILNSETAREDITASLRKTNSMHDDVAFVSLKNVAPRFDLEDDDAVMNYYSLRGLDNARDADAIVLIGAPHPNVDALRAEARLLSIGNPWVRAGGRELSTRPPNPDDPDDDSGPPVYRKLNYVDDEGKGRAVAAKTYTGLTGALFDGAHADELEQAAHRIRPILADEDDEKHVYLLTNVPTDLPVDRFVTFDEFLDPLAGLDIRDSALDLLDAMADAARDDANDEPYATDGGLADVAGTTTEWLDAAERGGLNISRRTVDRALNDLNDAGIVEQGEYRQNRGRLRTLTPKGASIASVTRPN